MPEKDRVKELEAKYAKLSKAFKNLRRDIAGGADFTPGLQDQTVVIRTVDGRDLRGTLSGVGRYELSLDLGEGEAEIILFKAACVSIAPVEE